MHLAQKAIKTNTNLPEKERRARKSPIKVVGLFGEIDATELSSKKRANKRACAINTLRLRRVFFKQNDSSVHNQ